MSAPVKPLAIPTIPIGPVPTASKPMARAPVELKGTTTFSRPPAHQYSYLLSLEGGKLRISLEDADSKKQWCTNELDLEHYIDPSNSIPDAHALDYVECFHDLLPKPSTDGNKLPRALQSINGDHLRLEIHVKMQALMKSRVVVYTFNLDPVSVERIDVLESKLQDLQQEAKSLRAVTSTGDSTATQEMQATISELRMEMKSLREVVKAPGIFLARATSQLGKERVIDWHCDGLKVIDGIFGDLSADVNQVNVTVAFDNGRSTRSLQINKGAQLVCFTSGVQQLSQASIINVKKGDRLSIQTDGTISFGYMTLTLLAGLTV